MCNVRALHQKQKRNYREQNDLYLQGLIFLKRSSLFTIILNHASIAANIYRYNVFVIFIIKLNNCEENISILLLF